MTVKQCESFLKLVETKSFVKAAQELFITKQGLSRAIQSMENELGTTLFYRTPYGTQLTQEGAAILPEIQEIVADYRKILKTAAGREERELNIIFSFGFFLCISPEIIFGYLERNRTLQFRYACYSDAEIEDKLLNGDFDLAFCSNPRQGERLNYIPLFRNYRCFAVHREHPLAAGRFLSVPDLEGVKIAVSAPEEYNDYEFLRRQFDAYHLTPDIFPCYESSTLLSFAEEKRGVSLIVSSLSQTKPSPDTRYVFLEDYASSAYDVNIITKKGRRLSAQAADFVSYARQYCQEALARRSDFPFDQRAAL